MKSLLLACLWQLRRTYYRWRYPNLRLAPDVQIAGSLRIGGGTRVTIGAGCRLKQRVRIDGPGELVVGANTLLNGPWIGCHSRITIGDDCLISDCFIVDTDYHNLEPSRRQAPPGPKATAPIAIGRNVWVGARASILKGVTIGADSVVGLGSVVRRAVPAAVVVIGNPAQVVKFLEGSPVERECLAP